MQYIDDYDDGFRIELFSFQDFHKKFLESHEGVEAETYQSNRNVDMQTILELKRRRLQSRDQG